MKLGIIDLDTSHPEAWIPLEREMGHEVVAVYDHGDVHPAGYAATFAKQYDIPHVVEAAEALLPLVDGVIIHSCDWSRHLETARPFVEAGKSVLIDKPLAGNRHELEQIAAWAAEGKRVTGGSALRFCDEVLAWKTDEANGTPHTLFTGCAVDDYNYGIHAYSLASGLMGPGLRSVQHLGEHGQRRLILRWENGRVAFLAIGKQAQWMPFHATIISDKGVSQFQPVPGNLYRAFLNATLPYLAGETDTPPTSSEVLIEAELAAIAARISWQEGNREVSLCDLPASDGYDGPAFAASYRAARYSQG